MYSSRMRTVRCSDYLVRGVSAQGVVWPEGCLHRGVSAQEVSAGGVSAQGVCLPKGGVCPGWCLPKLGGCLPRGPVDRILYTHL